MLKRLKDANDFIRTLKDIKSALESRENVDTEFLERVTKDIERFSRMRREMILAHIAFTVHLTATLVFLVNIFAGNNKLLVTGFSLLVVGSMLIIPGVKHFSTKFLYVIVLIGATFALLASIN